jgi:hypothetical protein
MKLAPVHGALAARQGVDQILVHTGQHYDVSMSDIFFSSWRSRNPTTIWGPDPQVMLSRRPKQWFASNRYSSKENLTG